MYLKLPTFFSDSGKTVQGVTTNFVYDGLNPVQEKNGATVTANLLTGLGIDQLFTRTDSAGMRKFFTDALGSTVALADTAGTVQTSYTYEPFGGTTQSGSASTNSYKYTEREDDGTGLYYYRARYYSPRLQRFISEDPIGFRGRNINLYGYVSNNPINRIDPLGLWELQWGRPIPKLTGPAPDPLQPFRSPSSYPAVPPVRNAIKDKINDLADSVNQCKTQRFDGLDDVTVTIDPSIGVKWDFLSPLNLQINSVGVSIGISY
ncbi:MAG: RHS repeat-associated core domain-containing protein [Nitrospira sp.]|nr:RHS repeat-associated core domain-containing protein [Nitrospira sp.]